jgi:hypothetical protein
VTTVRVDIDLSALQQAVLDDMNYKLRRGIEKCAQEGVKMWVEAVDNAKLSPYDKDNYKPTIRYDWTGPLEAEITAGYKHADEIETGRKARDLKDNLKTGTKTRIANNKEHRGQLYLIIPFRHNTPGYIAHAKDMPTDIYAQAKQLKKSHFIPPGKGQPSLRLSGSGHLVPVHYYNWGGRLPQFNTDGPHLGKYAGMVRMQTSTPNASSSAYMTFRVMGEWSKGWVIPAKPGLHLAEKVADSLQPILERIVGDVVSGKV